MNETCESYVVNKLMAVEKENDNLKENIKVLVADVSRITDEFEAYKEKTKEFENVIRRHVTLKHLDSGSRYVSTHDLNEWCSDEKDDLKFLVDYLGLVDTDLEENEGLETEEF